MRKRYRPKIKKHLRGWFPYGTRKDDVRHWTPKHSQQLRRDEKEMHDATRY